MRFRVLKPSVSTHRIRRSRKGAVRRYSGDDYLLRPASPALQTDRPRPEPTLPVHRSGRGRRGGVDDRSDASDFRHAVPRQEDLVVVGVVEDDGGGGGGYDGGLGDVVVVVGGGGVLDEGVEVLLEVVEVLVGVGVELVQGGVLVGEADPGGNNFLV